MCGTFSSTTSPLFKKFFNSAISTTPEGNISEFTKIFQYKVLQFKCISYYLKKQVNLLLNLRYLNKFLQQEMQSSIHIPLRKESHDFPGTGTCDKIMFWTERN